MLKYYGSMLLMLPQHSDADSSYCVTVDHRGSSAVVCVSVIKPDESLVETTCLMLCAGKLVRHYKTKHPDRGLPDGLLARIPSMSHDELNTALSQLAAASTDQNSCVRLSRSEGENIDSDDTQDLEVNTDFTVDDGL